MPEVYSGYALQIFRKDEVFYGLLLQYIILFQTWDDNETGQLPLLSYLIKYKPNQIITLLETHVEWAQDLVEVSPEQSLWVYALLALVEKPLHGDDVSTIRSLAK